MTTANPKHVAFTIESGGDHHANEDPNNIITLQKQQRHEKRNSSSSDIEDTDSTTCATSACEFSRSRSDSDPIVVKSVTSTEESSMETCHPPAHISAHHQYHDFDLSEIKEDEDSISKIHERRISELPVDLEDARTPKNSKRKLVMPPRSILKRANSTNETGKTSLGSGLSCGTTRSHVTFDSIQIRQYAMELGDNPSCTYGPPVQLSWECLNEDENLVIPFEVYETERIPRRKKKAQHYCLNYYKRVDILRFAGYDDKEIEKATKQVEKARRQRSMTVTLLPLFKVEAAVRGAGRKLKKCVKGKKKSKDSQLNSTQVVSND